MSTAESLAPLVPRREAVATDERRVCGGRRERSRRRDGQADLVDGCTGCSAFEEGDDCGDDCWTRDDMPPGSRTKCDHPCQRSVRRESVTTDAVGPEWIAFAVDALSAASHGEGVAAPDAREALDRLYALLAERDALCDLEDEARAHVKRNDGEWQNAKQSTLGLATALRYLDALRGAK